MTKLKLLFSSYIVVIISLFFYSFTQVDLSLTLSKNSIYQSFEVGLQHIGFFQRPVSATIFFVIISLLFFQYVSFLYLAHKKQIQVKTIKILTILTFVILVFSYNAFSYDLFNYIFDAKILTFYHLNPYLFKPTDFLSDPMLNFMRWTHRVYPYGPSWLILTAPLSFIGSNIFLLTFFLFKTLMGLTYLGTVYLIYKISEKVSEPNKIFNTIFFAFNPLVIIEGLISGHNDFPLIFFALLALYIFLLNKKFLSFISILFSIGIKYSTAVLLPIFGYIYYQQKKNKKINWDNIFLCSFLLSLAALILVILRTTFQPWYLIFPFAMSAFVSKRSYIFAPVIVSTIMSIFIYGTYVLMTDYAKEYPIAVLSIEAVGLLVSVILTSFFLLKCRLISKH